MKERLIRHEQDIQRAAHSIKAMAHPIRLKILCTLGEGRSNVQQIVEACGTTQSNISQHLAILRDKGILGYQKEANQVFYFIDDPRTIQLISMMREVFCTQDDSQD